MSMPGIEINTIYNEDCLETMKRMPDGFVDLVVTSPPYDNMRKYNGYSFEFEKTAQELYRVTKGGGVVVWVIGDQTNNGSESGTSFKQALYFKECGFNVHDTMIWLKPHFANPSSNRCHQVFEYMFVFSNGKPKTFNPIKDVPIKYGKPVGRTSLRNKDGTITNGDTTRSSIGEFGGRSNVWKMNTVGQENFGKKVLHPAMFPERLAADHIKMWSNEGELVFDPFIGSGTTAKACQDLNRNYIGSEISKEYCDIAEKRLQQEVLL